MIIVAGGDSFVFGSELNDQTNKHSLLTFPALLASLHNLQYDCAAWPGNANNAIVRMTTQVCDKYIKSKTKFGVLVTWTFPNRYEFRFNYHTGQKTSPWLSVNPWHTLDDTYIIENEFKTPNEGVLEKHKENLIISKRSGTSDFAKTWFKHVGNSEYYELYTTLKEILFLQNYLLANQVSYLFLAADNNFYQHPNFYRQQDKDLDALYDQIDWKKWFFFEPGIQANQTKQPRGFYQWAVENKYPMGTTHPLEEAHQDAANLIKEKFNELVYQSMEQSSFRN